MTLKMDGARQFVVRTDKLSLPLYFAGAFETPTGHGIQLSPVIFDAWFFDDEEAAQEAVNTLGSDDFAISPVESGESNCLN